MLADMSTGPSEDAKAVRFTERTETTAPEAVDSSAAKTSLSKSAERRVPERSSLSRSALAGLPRSESPDAERRSPSPTVQTLNLVAQETSLRRAFKRRTSGPVNGDATLNGLQAVPVQLENAERQWSGPVDDAFVSCLAMHDFHRKGLKFKWPTGSGKLDPSQPGFCDFGKNLTDFPLRDKKHIAQTEQCKIYSCKVSEDEHGLSERVAVKCIKMAGGKGMKTWKKEREALRDLEHIHIVALLGTFMYNDKAGIVMYPVAKYDLEEYLKRASLPHQSTALRHERLQRLRSFMPCLCSALIYLHGRHLKHRDIKPGNILIDRHSSLLISDFGIAKKFATKSDTNTSGQFTQQTNRYAAPEVLKALPNRGLEADIFCLGCVFLEIITIICGQTIDALHESIGYEEIADDSDDEEDTYLRDGDRVRRIVRYGDDQSEHKIQAYIDELLAGFEQRPEEERYHIGPEHFQAVKQMLRHEPFHRPRLVKLVSLFRVPDRPCPCDDGTHERLAPLTEQATEDPVEQPRQEHERPTRNQRRLVFYDARMHQVSHREPSDITGPYILVYDQKLEKVSITKRDTFVWDQTGYFMDAAQVDGRVLETHDRKVQLPTLKSLALRLNPRDAQFLFVKGNFAEQTLEETLEKGRRG